MAWSCASSGAVPRPFPSPAGAEAAAVRDSSPSSTAPPDTYALVGTALSLRGAPYRNGGGDPGGFDCSGFTQYVFAKHGIALPRDVHEQFKTGKLVSRDDLAAGDLLFFATTERRPSHVAILVAGDQFIHAPSSTGVVRVERLSSRYWSERFLGSRRVR